MSNPRRLALIAAALLAIFTTTASSCDNQADVVSDNLSTAADNFEINRRVVFFNGITDTYMLEIEGRCSIVDDPVQQQLEVTCQTGADEFKKHFLGLSDNVSYFVEQVDGADVSAYHYDVRFRPETILPDINLDIENGDDADG